MKKLLLLLIVTVSMNAQWQSFNIVDEFGDDTGKKAIGFVVDGRFSNSATTNSPARLRVVDHGHTAVVRILEYNSSPASFCTDYITLSIKKADGRKYFQTMYKGHYTDGFKYCGDTFRINEPAPKWRARKERKGKYFLIDKLREVESGDKILISSQSGPQYIFAL